MYPIVGGVAASYEAIPFLMKKLGKKRFVIFFQDVENLQKRLNLWNEFKLGIH